MSDLIDRYAAIDAIRKLSQDNGYIDMPHEYVTDAIRRLPSARLKHNDITTSEQPKMDRLGVKTGETCTDTIGRQAAIDAIGILLEQSEDDEHDKTWNNAIRSSINAVKHHLPSVQPEQSDTSEFWRKRADYYSDMCMNLIGEMGRGVEIESVKINENGIEFIKKQPPAQSIDLQELEDRFGEYVRFVVNDMLTGEGKRWTR